MTPEEFLQKLQELYGEGQDPERFHGEADDLIVELLKQLGYGEGAEFFDKCEKWYG